MTLPQVTECNTRFKKVCYFEYEHEARERAVKVCARRKERDCEVKGRLVCTHEREFGQGERKLWRTVVAKEMWEFG